MKNYSLVVGMRSPATITVVDWIVGGELYDLAFEAWERMTYGGWQLTPWEYLRWCSTYVEAIAEGVNSLTPLKEFFDAAR